MPYSLFPCARGKFSTNNTREINHLRQNATVEGIASSMPKLPLPASHEHFSMEQ
jgi:hypothetical protein